MGNGVQVDLRPPVLSRIWVCAFTVFVVVVLVSTAVRHRGASLVVVPVFLAAVVLFAVRVLRVGVRSLDGGVLRIRNAVGARTLTRDQIEGFRIDVRGSRRIGDQIVRVLLSDGTSLAAEVTRGPWFLRRTTERQRDELTAWLRAGRDTVRP